MKRIRILPIVLAASLFMASWSCSKFDPFLDLKDLDTEMEFKPSIIAPLAYGSFNLQDLLEAIDTTGFVSLTEDNLLYIYYRDTAYSVESSDIVPLLDTTASEFYVEANIAGVLWDALPPGSEMTFPKTDILDFDIEPGDQIDSVLLKSGGLRIVANSEFHHSGRLRISSPDIFKPNGDTLNREIIISDASGNFTSDTTYLMDGFKLEFSEEAGTAVIRINYLLTLKKEPGGVINPGERATIETSFEGMEFSHVYGFVSDREVLNVNQSLALDFFDIAASLKDITFKAPEFNLHVGNSFGIPLAIDLSNIVARSTGGDPPLPLIFEPDPSLSIFKVGAPTVEQLGQTIDSVHYINADNSNLEDILASSPNRLDFAITANTGTTPGIQNFLLDTSKMDIVMEIVLPMWLQTGGYALEDTIEMDIGSIVGDLNYVDSATITMNYINQLPLEVRLQGYFLNAEGIKLDSLFGEGTKTIEASEVDGDGELIASDLPKKFEVEMTGEQMSNLSGAVSLWFKADASTSEMGSKFVKFFSYYELSYNLFIDAYLRVNTDELLESDSTE